MGEKSAWLLLTSTVRRLISGEVTPAEAIDREILAVVSGDAGLLERFAEVFHIGPGAGLVA